MATSRVYVKIHHASDVLAGIPIGVALGLLGRKLVPLDGKRENMTGAPTRPSSSER